MKLIEKKKLRKDFEKFIERFGPTHFVTLATNANGPVSQHRMRDALKSWSARVNRALLGSRWQKKPDEHVFFFAFLEKPDINPHWHLMLQADTEMIADLDVWQERFTQVAEKAWTDLLPAGTVDVQKYYSRDVINYALKSALSDVEYISYVVPREYY